MSTPPVTISTEIKKIEGFLFDSKHLVLGALLVVALLFGIYLWESKRADVAESKAEVAAQVLKVAQDAAASSAIQNAAQQEQSKALEAQMVAVNQQLQTANAQLQAANVQLISALAKQRASDATLTPQGQAARWQQIVPTAHVATTSTGFTVDAQGGVDTIQALEELPFDRQEIVNLTTQIGNNEKTIANDAVALNVEKIAHASDVENDQKKLAVSQDQTKKVQDDFTAYKHKARKNYIRAFVAGFVAGVIGTRIAGF